MSNDWIKWTGGVQPVSDDTLVTVMYREGSVEAMKYASAFRWLHDDDGSDIVAYIVEQPAVTRDDTPCACIPGQCRGEVVDGKLSNGYQCREEFARGIWFEWNPTIGPSAPHGLYMIEWELRSGLKAKGACYSAYWGEHGEHTVARYRWTDPRVVLLNPFTGKLRDPRDIISDPEGKTIVKPGEPLKAVEPLAVLRPDLITDPAKIEAAFEHDQRTADEHAGMDEAMASLTLRVDSDTAEMLVGKSPEEIGVIVHEQAEKLLRERAFGGTTTFDDLVDQAAEIVDDEEPLIEGQIKDFMQGIGASEDQDNIKTALASLNLSDATVDEIMRRIVGTLDEQKRDLPRGKIIHIGTALHIVRNPYGWSDDAIRQASIAVTDSLEAYLRRTTEVRVDVDSPSYLAAQAEITRKLINEPAEQRPHSHYFKDVSHLDTIDVYRVLALFAVNDPCIQHAVKKLLVAGGRGAGKDISRDIKEAIDSLQRWQDMRREDGKKPLEHVRV